MRIFYSTSPETAQEINDFVEIVNSPSSVSKDCHDTNQSISISAHDVLTCGADVSIELGLNTELEAAIAHDPIQPVQISSCNHHKDKQKHHHTGQCNCGADHLPLHETEHEKLKRLSSYFGYELLKDYVDSFDDQAYEGVMRSGRYVVNTPPIEGWVQWEKEESSLNNEFEEGIRCLSELTDAHKQRLCSKVRQDDYNCLNEAQWLLQDERTPKGTKWRTAMCGRFVIGEEVEIVRNGQGKTRYRKLARCGAGWTCPVCAKKIAEARRAEISQGLDKHYAEYGSGSSAMLTLTFPHGINHNLSFIVHQFLEASRWMRGLREYRRVCKLFIQRGYIRVVEVTHGYTNGWHPHSHEVWLFERQVTVPELEELKQLLYPLWKKACIKFGLGEPDYYHGMDITQAYSPAEYLVKFDRMSKWGTASELAKAAVKTSFSERSTPTDLLRRSARGDREAGRLFVEYANAFFGKSQITWSRGLKGKLGVNDVTDQEIVDNPENDDAKVICTIPKKLWYSILLTQNNRRACDVRALILDIVEVSGAKGLDLYIRNLKLRSSLFK